MYRYAPLLDAADASATPCARANHAACASAVGDTMFVFGGEDTADRMLDDLWALHVAADAPPRWQLLNELEAGVVDHGRPQPCARTGAAIVSSPDGALWLFGGDAGAQGGGRLNDMWRWPSGAVGRAWERVEMGAIF
jgi:hypothetical protein